jgi:ribosomal protein S3
MGHIGVKVWIFKREFFKKTVGELFEEVKLVGTDGLGRGRELPQESNS